MDPRRECLYDVYWQVTRIALLHHWHEDPESNIRILLNYLRQSTDEYDRFVRTWRCLNLLKAVPLGENKQVRRILLKGRQGFQIRYDKFHGYGFKFKPWDWTKVRVDLTWLLISEPDAFQALKKNLEGRVRKVGQSSSVGYMQQKPEAAKFIRLMRDVEFDGRQSR